MLQGCLKCFMYFRRVFQVFHLDVAYVAMAIHICFKCFRCFRLMLQLFHPDVAEVDLDITYVATVIHECFKRMFQVFHLFHMYFANVSAGYFKNRSSVAHVFFYSAVCTCRNGAVIGGTTTFLVWIALPSLLPPFPSLPSISLPWQFELRGETILD